MERKSFKVAKQVVTLVTIIATYINMMSCSSCKSITFSHQRWNIEKASGNVVSSDSTMKFTFGHNFLVDPAMTIISNRDSLSNYPGVEEYIQKICASFAIRVDSVLFYAPIYGVLFVEYTDLSSPLPPHSITADMEKHSYSTSWMRNIEEERWDRGKKEMYTNIVLHKYNKQLLVLDRFSYGNKNIGRISILQTNLRKLKKMGLPQWTFHWADLTKPRSLEIIADFFKTRREVSIENYLIDLNR